MANESNDNVELLEIEEPEHTLKTREDAQLMILSVDIESTGPFISRNEIVSIGYCLGDTKGNIVENKRIDFKVTKPFDPQCRDSFWKQNPVKFRNMQKNAIHHLEALRQFEALLDRFDGEYDLHIISDNNAYDFAFIAAYFDNYLHRRPMNYKFGYGDMYRSLEDVSGYER